ncbi:MAG: hypothetical protein II980_01005 [Clostridia bacterium]|nr:hypothetical protein [Clostridia bacterium]
MRRLSLLKIEALEASKTRLISYRGRRCTWCTPRSLYVNVTQDCVAYHVSILGLKNQTRLGAPQVADDGNLGDCRICH